MDEVSVYICHALCGHRGQAEGRIRGLRAAKAVPARAKREQATRTPTDGGADGIVRLNEAQRASATSSATPFSVLRHADLASGATLAVHTRSSGREFVPLQLETLIYHFASLRWPRVFLHIPRLGPWVATRSWPSRNPARRLVFLDTARCVDSPRRTSLSPVPQLWPSLGAQTSSNSNSWAACLTCLGLLLPALPSTRDHNATATVPRERKTPDKERMASWGR
ncbi:hypothetical protein GGX14DRAFT_555818 [Mycena pura]|uniref:Uncharacterized protein n=1 Tax=Mycena pura TaxID=153505 RepID=A0AAD6YSB2_9AGAR|nr:hypothetical protein GGX14DRAFT_555818 [Mycena pura]